MAKNPWTNIEEAFKPMYDEKVVIELKDGSRLPIDVIVFTDNTSDPINEEMLDSEMDEISILVSDRYWEDVLSKVRRGDVVIRPCKMKNGKYSVSSVTMDASMGLIVRARSMK